MATVILSSLLSTVHKLEAQSSFLDPSNPIDQHLNKIRTTMLRLHSVVSDADVRERREEPVKNWLRDLKEIAHVAEDVLEDLDFSLQKEEVNNAIQLPFHVDILKDIGERLDGISHQCQNFHFIERDREECSLGAASDPLPSLLSSVDAPVVFGREEDKKRVIDLLLRLPCETSYLSVIPIVGAMGIGKTTLASLVYNDPIVSGHFDVKFWVSGSHDVDLVRLMTAIVASVDDIELQICPILSILQHRIRWMLEGKRFLLVVDGARNEDQSLWKSLQVSLAVGLEGSMVLVTTDNESVARVMQTTLPFYRLRCLSNRDCWLLFQQCAFGDQNSIVDSNLVEIGRRIIEKCRGLPLAAKMLGSLLRFKTDEATWNDIYQSSLWDSDETIAESFPAISLCYYDLPAYLQRCFAYCALFPEDYHFKKYHLVLLWMAQGFILSKGSRQVEDIGIEYFDELLRRSFFQCSPVDDQTFVMNACIHDLAQSISEEEICRTEDGNLHPISCKAWHASLVPQDYETSIQIHSSHKPRSMRTFMIINRLLGTHSDNHFFSETYFHLQIPNQSFTSLEYIRTLDLSGTGIKTLPDSIDSLKHLRYLGLKNTQIMRLPESICNLYHLQTLDLTDSNWFGSLPQGIKNLKDLRHLYIPRNSNCLVHVPPGIGLLTNLQTLNMCYVWREGMTSMIREFKNLVNLAGEVEVRGLQNVPNADDAKGVFKDKENIRKLILQSGGRWDFRDCGLSDADVEGVAALFGDEASEDDLQVTNDTDLVHEEIEENLCEQKIVPRKSNEELEEGVFDALQPHTNIKELVIQCYLGAKFPIWMGDSSFSNLVSVTLVGYSGCKVLPAFGQLPSLKHLVIKYLVELQCIGLEFYGAESKRFPSLETLQFERMHKWEDWLGVAECEFPRLYRLVLDFCRKLRRIPPIFPSLSKLVLQDCDELTCLPALPLLTSIEINRCHSPMIWSSMPLHLIARLQSLKIYAGDTSSNSSLPLELLLSSANALKNLKIRHFPEIEFSSNQELPSTLQILEIADCRLLTKWCHRHGSTKLVHIPRVILDGKNFHPTEK